MLVFSAALFALTQSHVPRGVAPSDATAYAGAAAATFACDGGARSLPMASVNDDFCDCSDGSDEPGTSACSNGRFFCLNVGHAGRYIRSSRVGDGLCDCCDGSDEDAGVCADRCVAAASEYNMKHAVEIAETAEGARKKLELVEEGKRIYAEKSTRLTEQRAELAALETSLRDLEQKKIADEATEREVQGAAAADHAATLEKQLGLDTLDAAGLRTLVRSDVGRVADATSELRAHSPRRPPPPPPPPPTCITPSPLSPFSSSPHARAQIIELSRSNASVAEALIETLHSKSLLASNVGATCAADGTCTPAGAEADAAADALLAAAAGGSSGTDAAAAEASAQTLEAMIDSGASAAAIDTALGGGTEPGRDGEGTVLQLPEGSNGGAEEEDVVEDLDAVVVVPPTVEEIVKAAALVLLNEVQVSSTTAEADASRVAFTDATREKDQLVNSVANTEREVGAGDYGVDGQWRALRDQCFERQHHSYTYEVCLFKSASQREGAGSRTNLGSFSGWEEMPADDPVFEGVSANTTPLRRAMKFTNGQHCWNAGNRELLVRVLCGGTTEVLSIDEPSTCHYEMKLQSPAAC